jgi:hypothetical protein
VAEDTNEKKAKEILIKSGIIKEGKRLTPYSAT